MPDDLRNSGLDTGGRDDRGRFSSGNSGKPLGARNRATRVAEALFDAEAGSLSSKAIELALAGDLTALRLCLERVLPPRKDRPVTVELPTIETAADHTAALSAVVEAIANGDIAPVEAKAIADVLEVQRKAFETETLERRIADLEARTAK